MTETLAIPARFNGPPDSANGGYTCGLVAQLVGAEAVEVSLRAPPPLDHELSVHRDGERVELRDGDTLVAEGRPVELLLEVPDPVDREEVAAAGVQGRERWFAHHPFPTCIVCGPNREPGDGMQVFPVELPRQPGLFGATWTPDDSDADEDGNVRPELVWAALDCPTSAPVANFGAGPACVLARLTARLGCPPCAGEPHTLLSWKIGEDGRKREGACALYDSAGRLLCASHALWIELRAE